MLEKIRRSDGRFKCKLEDNIKIGLELGYEGTELIHLVQVRVHFFINLHSLLVLVFTYCR
jgi:hypothetical protein